MPLLHPLFLTTDFSDLTPDEIRRVKDSKNHKKYRQRHPERVLAARRNTQREVNLRLKFGLTLEDYDALVEEQEGKCAICGTIPVGDDLYRKGKKLAVDHNHDTGKVRGLLCDLCNRALGQFHDDPNLLRRAIDYIEDPTLSQMERRGYQTGKTSTKKKVKKVWCERTDVLTEDLVSAYLSDPFMSCDEVAKMFSVARGLVYHRLARAGINFRTKKQATVSRKRDGKGMFVSSIPRLKQLAAKGAFNGLW
jgi:hypothetical protein